jgi:hypothetical protein
MTKIGKIGEGIREKSKGKRQKERNLLYHINIYAPQYRLPNTDYLLPSPLK